MLRGGRLCVQECPTNAITIASSIKELSYAKRGPVAYLPPEHGWQPLDAYTRANPEEPGETPWGDDHAWHVAERKATWQSWRTWLGERKEDLRAPCQAACPVAIIGAGPTGLSAAYYLARRGYGVTVFDAMPVAGGMMAIGIPDYRLPRTELNRDIDAIRELGVELRLNTAIGRDISLDDLQRDYDAVLIAVGAQRSQRLGIPGEGELKGVIPATTFLKDFNLDPTTRLEGEVAVVGGGSTAMDADRSALRAGASKVHFLYRRTRVEMPAQAEEVRAALAEGIVLHELVTPVQMLSSGGHVHAVRCQRMALSDPDEKGRRFAAGDVTYGPKSIIHAAAHGRQAARSIHAYLTRIPPHLVHEMPDDEFETESTLPPHGRITLDLRPTPREIMPLRDGNASRDRSIEFAKGFTEEQARREASRCLRCDLAYLCPSIHVISADTIVSAARHQ